MIGADSLQGHWRRAWLKAPGVIDHDTSVHWMQVGTLYADIRIPAARPDTRGATALADLGDANLRSLLEAEGFAGEIVLDGDVCTWAREINWHGEPDGLDAGRLRLEAWSELVEEGVHANYSELWHRAGESSVFARRFFCDDTLAFLVSVGDRFVFGSGPRVPPQPSAARKALAAGERSGDVARQFDHGYVFGRWVNGVGQACLATNPLWEGQAVVALESDALCFSATDFYGAPLRYSFPFQSSKTCAA